MFSFFKSRAKSSKQQLEEKYNRILDEIHQFSISKMKLTDRRIDNKLLEAQEVFREISNL